MIRISNNIHDPYLCLLTTPEDKGHPCMGITLGVIQGNQHFIKGAERDLPRVLQRGTADRYRRDLPRILQRGLAES